MIGLKYGRNLLLLMLLTLPFPLYAAPASFDLDIRDLERQEPSAKAKPEKKPQHPKKPAAASQPRQDATASENPDQLRYTVQPGDHIFKILMVRFGMSNEAAERLIPEIARINNIADIRRLSVGQIIVIPGKAEREQVANRNRGEQTRSRETSAKAAEHQDKSPAAESKGAVAAREPLPPARKPVPVPRAAGKSAHRKTAVSAQEAASPLPPAAPPATPAPARAALTPAPTAALEPAPAPAPAAHVAGLSAQSPSAAAIPVAVTWICSATEHDTAKILDSTLNALSVTWYKNRIVQSEAPVAFSIRVDRYFEYRNERYIVSIGESDPYNYTLIRLLEGAGYRVLRLGGKEDFETVNRKLLSKIGVVPEYGRHVLSEGRTATGFLIQQEDAGGRRVVVSAEPAAPQQKWALPHGCGGK